MHLQSYLGLLLRPSCCSFARPFPFTCVFVVGRIARTSLKFAFDDYKRNGALLLGLLALSTDKLSIVRWQGRSRSPLQPAAKRSFFQSRSL